jgi:hypothetical protein
MAAEITVSAQFARRRGGSTTLFANAITIGACVWGCGMRMWYRHKHLVGDERDFHNNRMASRA